MKRFLIAWLFVLIGILIAIGGPAEGAPPVDPAQPRPDTFPCGTVSCDVYNVTGIKAKARHAINYRLVTEPGCVAGSIPADMARLEAHMAEKVKFQLVRNDLAFDFTVHINCGNEQIRLCGSVNVFCLGRGFPTIADVDISDVLSNYFPDTRLAILCHEICGHALGTWNEQYATCAASCNFAPSPGWHDYMNTGPESRHGFESIELGRWERTMYELPQIVLGVQGFYGASYYPDGRMEVYMCGTNTPGATRVAIMAVAPWGAVYFSGNYLPLLAGCQSFQIVSEPGWCFNANVESDTSWMYSRNDVRLGCR